MSFQPPDYPEFKFPTFGGEPPVLPDVTLGDYVTRKTPEDLGRTNPKDQIADGKVPLWLLSPIAEAHWALAQYAGMLKYGAWNWRVAGVRMSVYISAMKRHMAALLSGEEFDPVDGTRHEGNIMACAAIILEARLIGKLINDMPPLASHRRSYQEVEAQMKALKIQYADKNPRHYTWRDEIAVEPA
jgi:hypothetical protein